MDGGTATKEGLEDLEDLKDLKGISRPYTFGIRPNPTCVLVHLTSEIRCLRFESLNSTQKSNQKRA